jgi:hypothetical protein
MNRGNYGAVNFLKREKSNSPKDNFGFISFALFLSVYETNRSICL